MHDADKASLAMSAWATCRRKCRRNLKSFATRCAQRKKSYSCQTFISWHSNSTALQVKLFTGPGLDADINQTSFLFFFKSKRFCFKLNIRKTCLSEEFYIFSYFSLPAHNLVYFSQGQDSIKLLAEYLERGCQILLKISSERANI